MSSDQEAFLTPKQVSDWLGLAPSTLADLRTRGEGPAFTRLSARNVRYAASDVREWLDRCRVEAGSIKVS
ncbi:MAG: helix-turn-helix domain-containing protein [Micrococcales bacterium]|nr:helix-turn-helix domain-containing protein [Micrococcales bacterium]